MNTERRSEISKNILGLGGIIGLGAFAFSPVVAIFIIAASLTLHLLLD